MKITAPRSRAAGFTLVEMLVATVVALFATLVITQTFALSETFRRSGTSGGDANFSGAVGTYLMDRDLAAAGYGINTATYYGCTVSLSDQSPPTGTAPRLATFTLAPVHIDFGATAQAPDAVWIVASGSSSAPGLISFASPMVSATDNYTVASAFGVNSGDLLVLAQAGVNNCTLVQATNTPTSASSNQNVIQHASGAAADRYNPAGGLGIAYPATAVIMDLGKSTSAIVNRYYIQNNTLMVDQQINGQLAQPVAANIVQLKAEYGEDNVGDGAVHVWTTNVPATSADWASILAVRVAMVAQSANPEKPTNLATNTCTTTTQPLSVTWEDSTTWTLDVSGASAPGGINWTCFRYKVFHVTTSLRNSIWTPL